MTIQYQGVWSLQSAAQLQSTQRWVTDPLFENTTLLLQADDAANGAQNNTFRDSSSNNFAITRNGNPTQGSFTPFSQAPGWWGINFNRGYLSATLTGQAAGTGSFTYELFFWVNVKDAAVNNVAALFNTRGSGSGADGIDCQITSTGQVQVGTSGSILFTSGAGLVADNAWYHLAVVRNGSTNCTVYLNGRSIGTFTAATNYSSTNLYLGIFGGVNDWFKGYISNFRYTRDAVYTSNFTVSATPLAVLPNTQFLTAQANRYLDASANSFVITPVAANGGTSVQPFSPFAPQFQWTPSVIGGSGYFDGTGDSLTGNGVLVTTTTANTFSVEGWIYPTTFANVIWLVGDMAATSNTNNICVEISATSGAVNLYWWTGSIQRCTSTTNLRLNQWNWFAIVVNAGAISIYVNSTTAGQSGTTTLTNRSNATQNFAIGQNNSSATPNAYIGSLRWSTSARTISAIPTEPYTSDANTRLLLNFTNAGIVDATMKNNLETVGNAQINTSIVKYGSGSMAFDGTGDILQIPKRPYFDFPGDFTIEFWLYVNSLASYSFLMDTRSSVSTFWLIDLTTAGVIGWGPDATIRISSSAITTGQWYHVAISRSGASTRMFLNGTQTGSTYTSSALITAGTTSVVIGGSTSNTFNANVYMDDIRITTGIARYTANFIPPSVALPRQ